MSPASSPSKEKKTKSCKLHKTGHLEQSPASKQPQIYIIHIMKQKYFWNISLDYTWHSVLCNSSRPPSHIYHSMTSYQPIIRNKKLPLLHISAAHTYRSSLPQQTWHWQSTDTLIIWKLLNEWSPNPVTNSVPPDMHPSETILPCHIQVMISCLCFEHQNYKTQIQYTKKFLMPKIQLPDWKHWKLTQVPYT